MNLNICKKCNKDIKLIKIDLSPDSDAFILSCDVMIEGDNKYKPYFISKDIEKNNLLLKNLFKKIKQIKKIKKNDYASIVHLSDIEDEEIISMINEIEIDDNCPCYAEHQLSEWNKENESGNM
ncbi:MAG: hypothetical protein IKP65_01325 [Alphaproteobacteria bacterium]|nr:hypothetical protein [Alphaproteobacteria bacterium]